LFVSLLLRTYFTRPLLIPLCFTRCFYRSLGACLSPARVALSSSQSRRSPPNSSGGSRNLLSLKIPSGSLSRSDFRYIDTIPAGIHHLHWNTPPYWNSNTSRPDRSPGVRLYQRWFHLLSVVSGEPSHIGRPRWYRLRVQHGLLGSFRSPQQLL